jgi:hypothetical protein
MSATEAPADTPAETEVPEGLVHCSVCEQNIAPTRVGGTRPRDHNTLDGARCSGSMAGFTLPDCDRCDGGPREPRNGCRSALFHPEVWMRRGKRLGNAAAAGEIVGGSGEHYQWLVRNPPEGPRRAPAHVEVRNEDAVRFYDLDAVEYYSKHRPGPGGRGPRPRRRPAASG